MGKGIVYCPECARELYKIGSKQTIDVKVRCKCGKFFRINPLYMRATEISRPERKSSSGKTFY